MRKLLPLAALCALAASAPADAGPRRVLSLSLCTDELLLRLAPKEKIAAVTWLARDARRSTVAALAADVPVNHGFAEEAVGLNPDLVLANAYSARPAVEFLKRRGVPVLDLAIPRSLAEVRTQIADLAEALGEREKGEALIAEMDRKVAAHPPASHRPKAVLLGPNGFATSYSPVLNEVFAHAGLENLAASLGRPDAAGIPLESVVLSDVDILVLERDSEAGATLANEVLRHPAIAALRGRATMAELPSPLWTCAGPQLADAVDILARARARHEAK